MSRISGYDSENYEEPRTVHLLDTQWADAAPLGIAGGGYVGNLTGGSKINSGYSFAQRAGACWEIDFSKHSPIEIALVGNYVQGNPIRRVEAFASVHWTPDANPLINPMADRRNNGWSGQGWWIRGEDAQGGADIWREEPTTNRENGIFRFQLTANDSQGVIWALGYDMRPPIYAGVKQFMFLDMVSNNPAVQNQEMPFWRAEFRFAEPVRRKNVIPQRVY